MLYDVQDAISCHAKTTSVVKPFAMLSRKIWCPEPASLRSRTCSPWQASITSARIRSRNNLVPGACFLAQPNMLPVTSFHQGFSVYIAISVGLPLPWGLARSSASILPHALRHRHHLHLTFNPCGALLCRAAGISSSSWLRALRHRQFLAGCWTGSG